MEGDAHDCGGAYHRWVDHRVHPRRGDHRRLTRLIVPGKQNISVLATIALGIVAAVIGGILWVAIFPDKDGIAWIG